MIDDETRSLLRNLWYFIRRGRLEVIIGSSVAALVTVAVFYHHFAVSDSFLSNLVTIDSILLAFEGLIVPLAFRGTELDGFIDELKAQRKESQNNSLAQFFARSSLAIHAIVTILIPIIVISPIFVSAILSLVASLECGFLRFMFAELGFFLMLAGLILFLLLIWKETLFVWKTYLR